MNPPVCALPYDDSTDRDHNTGVSTASCRRAAFLHDIGKGFTASGEGSHALEGADLARRHGEGPEIVNAIASHHNEVPQEYVEGVNTQAADAISGSRPVMRSAITRPEPQAMVQPSVPCPVLNQRLR